jgi:hypothetical protein
MRGGEAAALRLHQINSAGRALRLFRLSVKPHLLQRGASPTSRPLSAALAGQACRNISGLATASGRERWGSSRHLGREGRARHSGLRPPPEKLRRRRKCHQRRRHHARREEAYHRPCRRQRKPFARSSARRTRSQLAAHRPVPTARPLTTELRPLFIPKRPAGGWCPTSDLQSVRLLGIASHRIEWPPSDRSRWLDLSEFAVDDGRRGCFAAAEPSGVGRHDERLRKQ